MPREAALPGAPPQSRVHLTAEPPPQFTSSPTPRQLLLHCHPVPTYPKHPAADGGFSCSGAGDDALPGSGKAPLAGAAPAGSWPGSCLCPAHGLSLSPGFFPFGLLGKIHSALSNLPLTSQHVMELDLQVQPHRLPSPLALPPAAPPHPAATCFNAALVFCRVPLSQPPSSTGSFRVSPAPVPPRGSRGVCEPAQGSGAAWEPAAESGDRVPKPRGAAEAAGC